MNHTSYSYQEAILFLESLYFQGVKLGLSNTYNILERVGNPHEKSPWIHVAGTNGKGSICSLLASGFHRAGLNTGLYTSPHLISVRERIRYNGEPIGENEFATCVCDLREKIKDLLNREEGKQVPTFFEFITVLAFMYFQKKHVDIGIIEVGLGGRLDATNVITPLVSVISNIHYDHMQPLGKDKASIAREKAGIIKNSVPIICGDTDDKVYQVISKIAMEKKAILYGMGKEFSSLSSAIARTKHGTYKQENLVRWREQENTISSYLLGPHQADNVAVAYAVFHVLKGLGVSLSKRRYISGMTDAFWPGRLQFLGENIVVDSAHNVPAMESLCKTIDHLFPTKKWHTLFAVCDDKMWQEMLQHLSPLTKKFIFPTMNHARALPSKALLTYIKNETECEAECCENAKEWFKRIKQDGNILVAGSIYLAGEILACSPDSVSIFRDSTLEIVPK